MNALMKFSTGLMIMAILVACDEDKELDDPSSDLPVIVQFGDDFSLPENGGLKKVALGFSKTAPSNGSVSIKVTTISPGDFQTEPAIKNGYVEIPIFKGDDDVFFNITPVDNQTLGQNKTVEFELVEISDGFTFGTRATTTITIVDDEAPVTVNFASESGSIPENDSNGFIVYIGLSTTAPEAGEIIIQLTEESDDGSITTQPAFDENGRLTIPVEFGSSDVSFKVIPVKDPLLKGHKSIDFDITEVSGAIIKGTQLSFELVILDEELISKPKSYESFGGGWRSKRTYEYNEQGRIKKVKWETETPNFKSGTYTYYYDDNGLISQINSYEGHDEYFYQEDGKIVKSEVVENGIIKSYREYGYDPAGNLGGIAIHHRQPSGEYVQSFIIINLFFENGNIYKQLTYLPGDESEDDVLISTKTYDQYVNDAQNPFPMVESFPYDGLQKQLPTLHRIEEGGADLTYHLSYEFNSAGLVSKRTVSGAGNDVTYFEYY